LNLNCCFLHFSAKLIWASIALALCSGVAFKLPRALCIANTKSITIAYPLSCEHRSTITCIPRHFCNVLQPQLFNLMQIKIVTAPFTVKFDQKKKKMENKPLTKFIFDKVTALEVQRRIEAVENVNELLAKDQSNANTILHMIALKFPQLIPVVIDAARRLGADITEIVNTKNKRGQTVLHFLVGFYHDSVELFETRLKVQSTFFISYSSSFSLN
jgi:hypothetical protein